MRDKQKYRLPCLFLLIAQSGEAIGNNSKSVNEKTKLFFYSQFISPLI